MRSLSIFTTGAAAILLAVALLPSPSTALLSIPRENDTARVAFMNHTVHWIKNEPREIVLGGVAYPDTDGPVLNESTDDYSLYVQMTEYQEALMAWTENPKLDAIRNIMEEMTPRDCHNVTEFHMAYEWVECTNLTNAPYAQLISDKSFGARRLGIMGYNLQVVPVGVYTTYLELLEDDLVQDVCGDENVTTAVANQHVFVANFNAAGQYTDEAKQETKYVASMICFFCLNNVRQQFQPLAITFDDTKLMYTKKRHSRRLDTRDDGARRDRAEPLADAPVCRGAQGDGADLSGADPCDGTEPPSARALAVPFRCELCDRKQLRRNDVKRELDV